MLPNAYRTQCLLGMGNTVCIEQAHFVRSSEDSGWQRHLMAFVMSVDTFGREAGVCRAVLFILSDAEMVAFCTL